MTGSAPNAGGEATLHRRLAAACCNATWDLLLAERGPGDDDRMVDLCHASAWH